MDFDQHITLPQLWRSCRVPQDLEQIVDRREISILRSGRREGFALPRLASDRCSVARTFRTTGALSKTPVLCGHLDNSIFSDFFTGQGMSVFLSAALPPGTAFRNIGS